jgi:hypothetical protein
MKLTNFLPFLADVRMLGLMLHFPKTFREQCQLHNYVE